MQKRKVSEEPVSLQKPRKENSTLTHSSTSTTKVKIIQTAMIVLFRSIDLTKSSMFQNPKSSEKSEPTQFTCL